jgi:hypothetical protein
VRRSLPRSRYTRLPDRGIGGPAGRGDAPGIVNAESSPAFAMLTIGGPQDGVPIAR